MHKVFMSLDTEGLSGLVSWKEMADDPQAAGKAYIRELNWILDELFKADPEIEEVVICDSQSRGENLPYGVFTDKRVRLISGYPRQDYMLATLDDSFDMLMLVGYHSMIGTPYALMDHSYSSSAIYNIRINGTLVGETELNSYYAATYNVPLGFIDGDDTLKKELEATELKPAFVQTKEGLGRFSAKLYGPEELEPKFREGVREAVRRQKEGKLPVVKAKSPTRLEIDLMTTVMADAVEMIPGVKRIGGRTISYTSESFKDIMHLVLVTAQLAGKYSTYR